MKQENRLVDQDRNLHSYRFFGEEAEALGTRLDSARKSLAQAKNPWSKKYWQNVIDQLVFQWRSLPALHDCDARMLVIPRWTIDYDFYSEGSAVEGYSITDKMFDKVFRTSLQESWDRAREARLARAQY
jgi:hypothetical protein